MIYTCIETLIDNPLCLDFETELTLYISLSENIWKSYAEVLLGERWWSPMTDRVLLGCFFKKKILSYADP